MTRDDKNQLIDNLAQQLSESKHFYVADIASLNAEQSSKLRRKCFEKDIKLVVVKNTLLRKALERIEGNYEELFGVLKSNSSIMLTETGNTPAKLIKEFRKEWDKPILKGAYVEESIYIGDEQLDALASIKSKEELIGDVIAILQSPAKNVVSALQSGGGKLAGIIKTLQERE
ncbi:MAG: 50S ribosomal protein L10 [Bacteroidales bacterium]|nr:50S ribosomal protein L10 [Bacteroidales bacterium]MBN2817913.1 50S ribosomal protein L10 [Bacteroidales bacterium]